LNCTANNAHFRDAEFKDAQPVKTVERIKQLLAANNIETTESWRDTCVPYCFALTVTVNNSTFSSNGKGLTRDFALASAYGELIERLQLGYIGNRDAQKDGHYSAIQNADIRICADELYNDNPKWYQLLSEQFKASTGESLDPEAILQPFADQDGKVQVTPYFNVITGKKEYYPSTIQMRVYTANGCAAGNTPEEAIVQATSEIVERHHQTRIVAETICVPTIPDTYLQQYGVAYDIISFVRSCGYRVIVKDCSLGTGFPVVGVCFINEKTGKYHTHLGAYPVFEIALERALTESFQGHNIDDLATFDDFVYGNDPAYSLENASVGLTKGAWKRHPNFFLGESQYSFDPNWFFQGKNNRELLGECIAFFAHAGYDMLIRDCSCLGFPTYQVLVPGYSEVFPHRLSPKNDDLKYAAYAVKTLRNPSGASVNDMMGLLMHISQTKSFSKALSGVHGFTATSKLATTLTAAEQHLFMNASLGYVYYTLRKYNDAIKCISQMLPLTDETGQEELICLKRYLSFQVHRHDPAQIRQVLEAFHKPETVSALYANIVEKANPFDKFTLHCDLTCTQSCPIRNKCFQRQFVELTSLINKKTAELSYDDLVCYLKNLL